MAEKKRPGLVPPSYLSAGQKKSFLAMAKDFEGRLLPYHSHTLAQLVKALDRQRQIGEELDARDSLMAERADGQRQVDPLLPAEKEITKLVKDLLSELCGSPAGEGKRKFEVAAEEDEGADPYAELRARNKVRRERASGKT